jgi:hypothetical protein
VEFDRGTGEFNYTCSSGEYVLELYLKDRRVSRKWIDLEPGQTADLGEITYVPDVEVKDKGIPAGFYIFMVLVLLIFAGLGLMIYVKWYMPKDAIIDEE